VLPGVGAFSAATSALSHAQRSAVVAAARCGFPVLGICLGMQLLFESSDEGGDAGLGVLPGRVTRLRAHAVPQIGWNTLETTAPDPLLAQSDLRIAYYANSYACRPNDESHVMAWSTHDDDRFPAMVRAHRCTGVQFHPEKSSAPGVRFIRAWLDEVRP
jgi:imidazole glycerol-phosphate synthase subunit HisH